MNKENINPDPGFAGSSTEACNARLSALLHTSRATPALPPRFPEGVWRRIEEADAPVKTTGGIAWLDALAALVLRPRLALATVAVLMITGTLFGARDGSQAAHQNAQARYLAAVAPNSLH